MICCVVSCDRSDGFKLDLKNNDIVNFNEGYDFKEQKSVTSNYEKFCENYNIDQISGLLPLGINVESIYSKFKSNGYELLTSKESKRGKNIRIDSHNGAFQFIRIYINEKNYEEKDMYDIDLTLYEKNSNIVDEIRLFLTNSHGGDSDVFNKFKTSINYPSILIQSMGVFSENRSNDIAYYLIDKHIKNIENIYKKCGMNTATTRVKEGEFVFEVATWSNTNMTEFKIYRVKNDI